MGSFTPVLLDGSLGKYTNPISGYKKARFCVLKKGVLLYYDHASINILKGAISLEGSFRIYQDSGFRPGSFTFHVEWFRDSEKTVHSFSASSAAEVEMWTEAMTNARQEFETEPSAKSSYDKYLKRFEVIGAGPVDSGGQIASALNPFSKEAQLARAASGNDKDKLNTLIKSGIDINANYFGESPLHQAARGDAPDTTHLLISSGALINQRSTLLFFLLLGQWLENNPILFFNFLADTNGDTAFHVAVKEGKRKSMQVLMQRGAHFLIKNGRGLTPLGAAKEEKLTDMIVAIRQFGSFFLFSFFFFFFFFFFADYPDFPQYF